MGEIARGEDRLRSRQSIAEARKARGKCCAAAHRKGSNLDNATAL